MITYLTQKFTIAEHGRGDCWRTAFACVLGKEKPEDVPDFVYHEDGTTNDNYFPDTVNWLYEQGYELQSVGLGEWGFGPRGDGREYAPGIAERLLTEACVVTGTSPRVRPDGSRIYHACVAEAGQIVHDPHPERLGLVGNPDTAWLLTPIVR